MAKKDIELMLSDLYEDLDADYVRGQMDKAQQKVRINVFNIKQIYKHGYGLARQRQKELPLIPEEAFQDFAEKAFDDLVDHVHNPRSKAIYRKGGKDAKEIIFVQPIGTTRGPFRVIHEKGIKYVEGFLKEATGQSVKLDISARRSFGAAGHRGHTGEGGAVGTAQLALALEYMNSQDYGTAFNMFVNSVEAKHLREKFDLDLFFKTSGDKKQSTISVQENIEVGLVLVPSTENEPGKIPEDWSHVQEKLKESLLNWATRMKFADMEASPSAKERYMGVGVEFVLDELTKTKLPAKVKNRPKRGPNKKSGLTTHEIRIPENKKVKLNTRSAAQLRGGGRKKYAMHTLLALVQEKLPGTIANNMVSPRLVYRTGEFARSVTLNIVETAKGHPSFGYNYARYPYATFAKGGMMYTPDRDPIPLIEMSIREIATELAIGRYYIRRSN